MWWLGYTHEEYVILFGSSQGSPLASKIISVIVYCRCSALYKGISTHLTLQILALCVEQQSNRRDGSVHDCTSGYVCRVYLYIGEKKSHFCWGHLATPSSLSPVWYPAYSFSANHLTQPLAYTNSQVFLIVSHGYHWFWLDILVAFHWN